MVLHLIENLVREEKVQDGGEGCVHVLMDAHALEMPAIHIE